MIDTLRLLITLECNLSCSYCCNKLPKVQAQFKHMPLDQIDWSKYKNVCISGGEPFLKFDLIHQVIARIPADKRLYIYSNGLWITEADMKWIAKRRQLHGLNIGLHYPGQLDELPHAIWKLPPDMIRFSMEDKMVELFYVAAKLLPRYKYEKWHLSDKCAWKRNDCLRENEDIVVLENSH